MTGLGDWLTAAYVVSVLAGLACIVALAAAFALPGLEFVGSLAVRGLIFSALVLMSLKFAALAASRAEGRHG